MSMSRLLEIHQAQIDCEMKYLEDTIKSAKNSGYNTAYSAAILYRQNKDRLECSGYTVTHIGAKNATAKIEW